MTFQKSTSKKKNKSSHILTSSAHFLGSFSFTLSGSIILLTPTDKIGKTKSEVHSIHQSQLLSIFINKYYIIQYTFLVSCACTIFMFWCIEFISYMISILLPFLYRHIILNSISFDRQYTSSNKFNFKCFYSFTYTN